MGNVGSVFSYLQTILLMLLPVGGMMLVFYSAYQLINDFRGSEKKKVRDRLRDDRAREKAKAAEKSILRDIRDHKRLYETVFEQVSVTRKIQRWVEQADMGISGAKLLLTLVLAAGGIVGIGLLSHVKLYLTVGTAAAVLLLPILVVRFRARRRMKKLINQLPDVFGLIGQALRAGHALASGIQLVGKQLPDPAGTEFNRVFHEQNLGIKMEDALKNFADRVDQLDVSFFVTAVLIQRQTGGDLAEVLDKIGAVIRDRIKIMGQVKALTAEGCMSGWVLAVLPFFVFFLAWMLNPRYASILLYEKEGQYMLIGAAVMQFVGILMIRKIVNIKV